MPPWDNKFVDHLSLDNETLKKILKMKTTTKTDNNQKFSRKVREESVKAI